VKVRWLYWQIRLLGIVSLAAMLLGCNASAATLKIFAAASLTDALREIAAAYERESGNSVVFNFGASSFLARQIEEGAPADIFFSADEVRMDGLEKLGLLLKDTRRSLLGNSLVIVTETNSPIQIRSASDLLQPQIKRIAFADPKAVPAGVYARLYLEKQNLWKQLQPRVVPTDNVRAALAAVESGNVQAGFVFKTDASISRKIRIALEIPANDGPAISYPAAVVKDSRQPEAAIHFIGHLKSESAAAVFKKFGFVILDPPAK